MTLKELLALQELAGKKYQLAIDTLRKVYVELAAIDLALMNANINDRHADVRTFGHLSQNHAPFDHPIYSPTIPGDWREEITARRDTLINQSASRSGCTGAHSSDWPASKAGAVRQGRVASLALLHTVQRLQGFP